MTSDKALPPGRVPAVVDTTPGEWHDLEIDLERTGSGLYVDMENIQNGQELIESTIATWPSHFPKPIRLCLHVRGDQVELWRLWAEDKFGDMNVIVTGTQKFSASTSKNSADMAIATNAMADWIQRRVSHVAVLSNDSDFISLYASMRDEFVQAGGDGRNVPFLWVVSDAGGSLSPTAEQFFPADKMHMVRTDGIAAAPAVSDSVTVSAEQVELVNAVRGSIYDEMALAIIQDIPVGSFKSTDCKDVIERRWPHHHFGSMDGAQFGQAFKENIWPRLEERGVRMTNPGNQSLRYEMTDIAKWR